jgi:cytochrome b
MSTPADGNTQEIRVWDPAVRLFHWSLVVAFATAYLSGDDVLDVHVWSGYGVTGLVLFRLVWGVIGTRYARFRDFVRGPTAVLAYTRDVLRGRAARYLGHNPLGGAMVVALLLGLAGTTVSGLALYAEQEKAGPFAGWITGAHGGSGAPDTDAVVGTHRAEPAASISAAYRPRPSTVSAASSCHEGHRAAREAEGNEEDGWLGEVHEFLSNVTLGLVVMHILGVFVTGLVHRENLVKAMITGRKKNTDQ